MVELRKRAWALRAWALYSPLRDSDKKDAQRAVKRLDRAMTNTQGIIDRNDPKVNELVHACDFASTILRLKF